MKNKILISLELIAFVFILNTSFSSVSYFDNFKPIFESKFYPFRLSDEQIKFIKALRTNYHTGKLLDAFIIIAKDYFPLKNVFIEFINKIQKDSVFINAETDYKKADAILLLIHKFLFKRYIADNPSIVETFQFGYFNCVSATVIYNLVADYFGIKVAAVNLPSHISSVVHINGQSFETETTVRYGFDAGKRRGIADELKRITGFVYVPVIEGRRRYITNTSLLAIYLSQIGNLNGDRRKYGESLKLYALSLMIEPLNEASLTGIQITYYKLAESAMFSGEFEKGILLTLELADLFPDMINMRKASEVYFHNLILELERKGKYEEAIELIKKYNSHKILDKVVQNIKEGIYKNYAVYLSHRQEFQKAINLLNNVKQIYPSLKSYISNIYNNWFVIFIRAKKFNEILPYINSASEIYPELKNFIHYLYEEWLNELRIKSRYEEEYRLALEYFNKYNQNENVKKRFMSVAYHYVLNNIQNNNGQKVEETLLFIKKKYNPSSYGEFHQATLVFAADFFLKKDNYILSIKNFFDAFNLYPDGKFFISLINSGYFYKLNLFLKRIGRLSEIKSLHNNLLKYTKILTNKYSEINHFKSLSIAKTAFRIARENEKVRLLYKKILIESSRKAITSGKINLAKQMLKEGLNLLNDDQDIRKILFSIR